MQDIDRIFIATNFEEVEQENNEDRSLCRYEFYEIIVRMAREKYFMKKILPDMALASERIIQDILSADFFPFDENFRST